MSSESMSEIFSTNRCENTRQTEQKDRLFTLYLYTLKQFSVREQLDMVKFQVKYREKRQR